MQQGNSGQLTLILQGVLNGDQNIRKQAEDQINILAEQNLGQFLIEVSKTISNEQEKKEIRQISSTLIKNMISRSKYTEQWFTLPDDVKKAIKDNVLSTLASNQVEIRKAAALALAGICKIEIPRGQYLNIFDILSGTAQNDNLYIQLSSLTTLEYIYEEIKPGEIPNETVAKLLNTYYSLLNKENSDPQLIVNTLVSVQKFLPFISDFIKDNNYKIKFYDLVEKNVRNNNENVRGAALQIFLELSHEYYDSFQDYIQKIFDFSIQIIEKDANQNRISCIEIWNNIGYEEDERITTKTKQSYYYLQKYYQQLGDLCLKHILVSDYEDDEYTVDKACLNLIDVMGRCCSYDFVQIMLNYVATNIKSIDEKQKYSGFNVYRALIGNRHKQQFFSVIKDSLVIVADLLVNPQAPLYLKKLCANIMKTMTKQYGEEFVNDNITFDKLIKLFLNLLDSSSREVIYLILLSLNNLCKKVVWDEESQTNILSKHLQSICEPLMKICSDLSLYDVENNISLISFFLLGTLGERTAIDAKETMKTLFKIVVTMFENTLNPKNFPNENIRKNYQEYIASCLSGFLMSGTADKIEAAKLLQLTLNSFQQRQEVYEDGLTLIGSIATFTKEDFLAVMDKVTPYFSNGLRSTDAPSICKTSIFTVSDIIRGLEKNFCNYVRDFLPLVMNILSNPQVERTLKPQCFNIISDLFIFCSNEAFKSFDDIMKIIGDAIQATQIKFSPDSDKDNCKQFIDLREHLLETLTCIFYAVQEINKTKEFIPYVTGIVNYINAISCDIYACSKEIIKSGLLLIADFCNVYKEEIKPILSAEIIKSMINKIEETLQTEKDNQTIQTINWAKDNISKVFVS